MTTIREALRELERRGGGEPASPPVPKVPRRWRSQLGVAAVSAGVAAGIAYLVWAPIEPPLPAPFVPGEVPRAAEQPAPPPPQVASGGIDEAPRARVEKWRPAANVEAGPTRAAVAAPGSRSAGSAPRTADRDRDAAAARSKRASVALEGGGRVELRAIAFSTVQHQRTATLAVNGGAEQTVHEGETIGDIEVQLILRDMVYVRHGGTVVALTR